MGGLRKLRAILARPVHRRIAVVSAVVYLALFLVALQDVTLGGRGFGLDTAAWGRIFERTGPVTFEPLARLTVPGLTILISPLNLLLGGALSALVGCNLAVGWLALRRPRVCRSSRSAGALASLPALLAGGACCAPGVVLILGLQVSSLTMTLFRVAIPLAGLLLVVTLKLALDRTHEAALAKWSGVGMDRANEP